MSSSATKTTPNTTAKESVVDSALRPTSWEEYVGQEPIKRNLRVLLQAAESRKEPPEHILFYGPPGLGKTTLAHLIGRELGRPVKTTSGPAIEKVGDLASILTNMEEGEILFIDEIHRLSKLIEEVLYPAMESGVLNIIIGKGPSARTIELSLPPFTLVAATTRIALLSSPLRSRFGGGTFRLEYYEDDEISKIVERSARLLGIEASKEGLDAVATRSRKTPRTANFLLKRCRDFAQVQGRPLDLALVHESLALLGVDDLGLTVNDRALLEILIEKFAGGPTGVSTLAAALSEEEATVEDVHEPYLLRLGLIERTPRGRRALPLAYKHLGKELPPASESLF
ncbi:MAG: Holliday junction branch migration DNA helicase RuvB [Candidatus Vogelbacteria bacterium CG10_big_fil_rev_8_21_14_0_10_45_14]|uniref:Holliday junction branch migration complex subunit RuvB n=1 Tax=Candidatus Vogelbacteria bacterium CG10_big_fil_rev_8_21_14_0_10_45_14 TaxID=1975042 RepID=A0A2H0RI67_9BACT|nr:MAG: Holliday junction branch migration DNA helicase RuvB [Candidatus Vogelbacteria bacterium CG10_big_fil_rev_8_21_14_0_10_45_14]